MTHLIAMRPFFVLCLLFSLALQAEAAEVLVADKPQTSEKQATAEQAREQGFEPLLGENAKELWRGYAKEGWPNGWLLEDGVLARVDKGGDIMTLEKFADFELRLEWKISPGGNSGIIYRISTGDKASYLSGMECQILDNSKHKDGSDLHSTSALYGLYACSEKATIPAGEWNYVRIIVNGNHVEHWLNGKKVVECEIGSDDWNERLAKSKFADWPKFAKNREGHIALQDHHDPVWYRNVRIKRLGGKK